MLHAQVSTCAVVLGIHELRYPHVLGLDEVRQHVLVTPALIAGVLPCVVVFPVAPDIEHGIQDTAAPNDFASGPARLVPVESQARRITGFCFVLPINRRALEGRIQQWYV